MGVQIRHVRQRPGHPGRELRRHRRRQLRLRRRLLRRHPRRHRSVRPGLRRRHVRARSPARATTSSRSRSRTTPWGARCYKVTREEDINIGNGDEFVPAVPPPACAGPLHIVDVAGSGTDGYPSIVGDDLNGIPTGVTVPASTPTVNPTFVDIGGSPFEGQARPLCNVKLVALANGKSIVPIFNLFTDVPLPGASGASSSTTSPSRPIPEVAALRREGRASRSRRWASTTTPTGSSPPSSPTSTASSTSCCPPRTASTARRRPASAPTCTASSATTRAFPGAST